MVSEDQFFVSMFDDSIRFFSLEKREVFYEFSYENEEISTFELIKDNKTSFIFSFTRNGMLRKEKLFIDMDNKKVERTMMAQRKLINF